MIADWNMWLLTVIATTSSIAAVAQSFNAIHQLWVNMHNIRQFCSKKLGPAHHLSKSNFHPQASYQDFRDLLISIPTTLNTTTERVTYGKPRDFFSEWPDDSKIHPKISTVVNWEDAVRRYLMDPNANLSINDQFLQRMTHEGVHTHFNDERYGSTTRAGSNGLRI